MINYGKVWVEKGVYLLFIIYWILLLENMMITFLLCHMIGKLFLYQV